MENHLNTLKALENGLIRAAHKDQHTGVWIADSETKRKILALFKEDIVVPMWNDSKESRSRFYDKSLDPYFQNKYITGEKKAKILYGSKIVFNQMHYAEIESVNNRFFEAYGAGAFQLSDYRKILSRILPKEVKPELVSFNGIDDGIDKIKYYL